MYPVTESAAVIVGINSYQGECPRLTSAVNDAETVRDTLIEVGLVELRQLVKIGKLDLGSPEPRRHGHGAAEPALPEQSQGLEIHVQHGRPRDPPASAAGQHKENQQAARIAKLRR